MSSFLLPCHHLLVKCTIIYDYNFFHIGFEVISYDYNQLCNRLGHLVIDFLVVKDRIPSSATYLVEFKLLAWLPHLAF
jgi:hypothetical protein